MKIHGDARTGPHSRLLLCRRLIDEGWSLAQNDAVFSSPFEIDRQHMEVDGRHDNRWSPRS